MKGFTEKAWNNSMELACRQGVNSRYRTAFRKSQKHIRKVQTHMAAKEANNNDESDDFVELTAAAPETNWAA